MPDADPCRRGLAPRRIAFDGRYIQDHFPGIGRYAYSLARALAASRPAGAALTVWCVPERRLNARFSLAELASAGVALRPLAARPMSLAEQARVPWQARQSRLELVHVPHCFKPIWLPCRSVVNVHDVTPRLVPELLPSRPARLLWELSVRAALRTANRVVTLGEAARADLIREFGADPTRVVAVPAGVEPRFRPAPPAEVRDWCERLGLPSRFILAIGSNKPHKNLARLIEAFGSLPADLDAHLLLVGSREARFPADAEALARLPGAVAGRVRRLERVAEADLPALYAAASALAFPSLNEGFGLPAVEALACGAPVVAADIAPLREVVGDAGLYADPRDPGALRDALAAILSREELAADLRRRGPARAAGFSWAAAAARTWDLYREVLAE